MFKHKRDLEKRCKAEIKTRQPFCIPIGFYEVDVLKCYDGDTITVSMQDDFFIPGCYFNPRLMGIDSAERKRNKKMEHIEELLIMSKYDECLISSLLLSDSFPEQVQERVIIKTVPKSKGSLDTRDKFGRPLCKIYMQVSDRVVNVLSQFAISTDVFNVTHLNHVNLYSVVGGCDELRLVRSDEGSFFSLADLLVKHGFSIEYGGGSKVNHYKHFLDDEVRMYKLGIISELLGV